MGSLEGNDKKQGEQIYSYRILQAKARAHRIDPILWEILFSRSFIPLDFWAIPSEPAEGSKIIHWLSSAEGGD